MMSIGVKRLCCRGYECVMRLRLVVLVLMSLSQPSGAGGRGQESRDNQDQYHQDGQEQDIRKDEQYKQWK